MSQWTHVIGTIQTGIVDKEVIENALGIPCTWNDLCTRAYLNHRHVDVRIPMGSEGSINWHLVDTRETDLDGEPMYIVGEGTLIAIEGDLRDFGEDDEDIKDIATWFIEGCKKIDSRAAVLSIEVEYGNTYIINAQWDHAVITKVDRKQSIAIEELTTFEGN